MGKMLRVLVVDDSVLFRQIIGEAVQNMSIARLSGYARDGKEAINKIEILQPDIVTLDVEMPVMDGTEALTIIKNKWPRIKVIMVTSMNQFSVSHTIDALEEKAFSFIAKPDFGGKEQIEFELKKLVQGIYDENNRQKVKKTLTRPSYKPKTSRKPLVVAIGVSTGGPNALVKVISQLPGNLSVPILIVQHMPAGFTGPLAESLNRKSELNVKEAAHGELLERANVYIAPGGKHMKILADSSGSFGRIVITDEPPENFCKPSVDYLFRSLAEEHPGRVLPVIMTGMGNDGTDGLRFIKEHSSVAIGQDEESSTVYGMPCSAKNAGLIDVEVPLADIAQTIQSYL